MFSFSSRQPLSFRIRKIPLILLSFLLVSCAKPPHEIEAIDVTDMSFYNKLDCDELQLARSQEADELTILREKQIIRRQNDNARIMWLGILGGIANASSKDFDEEIELSKGKIVAIQSELNKRCILDEDEEREYQNSISHFFNHPESGIDKLIADARVFYFMEDEIDLKETLEN